MDKSHVEIGFDVAQIATSLDHIANVAPGSNRDRQNILLEKTRAVGREATCKAKSGVGKTLHSLSQSRGAELITEDIRRLCEGFD